MIAGYTATTIPQLQYGSGDNRYMHSLLCRVLSSKHQQVNLKETRVNF